MQSVLNFFRFEKGRVAGRLGQLILLLSTLLLLGALFQRFSGSGLTVKHHIPPEKMRVQGDLWTWSLRKEGFTNAEERGAVLLENGVERGSKAKRRHQMERGPGWYRVHERYLRFSPRNGTDPTVNGKKYELQVPMEVRDKVWWMLAGAFALGFALTRGAVKAPLEGTARMWKHLPAWGKMAGFFVVFLLVRWLQIHFSDYNDGVMSLRGVPGSDAGGWHEMARALAEGRGFDSTFSAQRPFYSLFLAVFHQVFGASVSVSLAVNCLLQALTATTVLVIGGILGSRFVAFTVASWMMFCPLQINLAQVVLTENMGAAFGAVGVMVFWRLLRRRTAEAALLAGLVVALGNLASGVFLLTVPLYPVLLVLIGWWQKWGAKRITICAAVFCFAVCMLFIPWMFRQQAVFGAFTQSLNTAELLYGGSHPTEKKLSAMLHEEARAAGFASPEGGHRYRYFMNKYVAQVEGDPAGYVRQLGEAFMAAIEITPRTNPVWQWLTRWLIVLVAVGQCVRRKFWLPAIPAGLALLTLHQADSLPGIDSFAVAAVILLLTSRRRQRIGWIVVIATACAFLLLAAMSGNVATDRFQTAGDWLLFLIWCGGWERLLVRSSSGLDWLWAKVPGWRRPMTRRMVARAGAWRAQGWRWAARTAWVLVAICALAAASTTVAYGWRSRNPVADLWIHPVKERELIRYVMQQHPDPRVGSDIPEANFSVRVIAFDEFKAFIDKNQDLSSLTRVYERRDHPRWVAEALLLEKHRSGMERVGMQVPGDISDFPQGVPFLAIGVVNRGYPGKFGNDMPLFETLGICATRPGDEPNAVAPEMGQLRWYKYHRDVKESVRRLKGVPASP